MNWKKMFQYRTEPEVIIKEVPAESTGTSDDKPDKLDEAECNMIVDEIFQLEEKYFKSTFPINHDDICRKFVANIKPRFLKEIMVIRSRKLPDILSPLMLLYPAFTENAGIGQGTFLLRLEELINENREAILADDEEYMEWLNEMKCVNGPFEDMGETEEEEDE